MSRCNLYFEQVTSRINKKGVSHNQMQEKLEIIPTFWQTIFNNLIGQNSEWFWVMTQAVIVGISLGFIFRQVRLQSFANMLSSLDTLTKRWQSKEIIRARITVCKEYIAGHKKIEHLDCAIVLNFFEELGLYYKKGVFKTDILWSMYAHSVENYWNVLSPMIMEYRAHKQDITFYENFEYMKNSFDKHSKKRGITVIEQTEDKIKIFAQVQIERLEESLSVESAEYGYGIKFSGFGL